MVDAHIKVKLRIKWVPIFR